MTIQPITPTVLTGEVHDNPTAHLTYGTDLDWVLDQIADVDPIDIESDQPSDTDWAVHNALNYLRAQIERRKAVQAGPRADVDYCEVDDRYGRACGPDLGLPKCAWHKRADNPPAGTSTPIAVGY